MRPRPGTRPDVAEKNRLSANPDLPYRKYPAEHSVWRSMLARCANARHRFYARYGGRGIRVCKRWAESFEAFLSDIGERPESGCWLDRIDNDGNYEPGNCAWRTPKQQARNRSNNRLIACFGREMTLAAWAEETGISRALIGHRLRAGWPVNEALTIKPSKSANSRHRRKAA